MITDNDKINALSEEFNDMLRFYVHDDEDLHQPIVNHIEVQRVGDKIYQLCLTNLDLIPAFEHELSTYGHKFIWLNDDFKPFATFMVAINTSYGMVSLYSNPNAFESMGKEIEANRDLIERHQKAEAAGDEVGMEAVKKAFARRLKQRQILYFFISPFHALLLGIRRLLRLFKR